MNITEENIDSGFMADKYLTFIINGRNYAFSIENVKEIIGVQSIMPVPEFPEYAKGIINVRGDVIPVIDIRLRFKIAPQEYNERTCIIIASCLGRSVGFIVDTVSSVMDIPSECISGAPRISSDAAPYITGVGKLNDKLIMILDSERLLTDEMMKEVEAGLPDSK